MNLQDLINSEIEAADKLLNLAESEGRAMTDDEQETYEAHIAEAEKLQAKQKAMNELKAKRDSFKKPEARRAVENPAASIKVGEPEFLKDPKMGFAKKSDFFEAVIDFTKTGTTEVKDHRLRYLSINGDGQNSNNNPDGGFLIPEGHMGGVMTVNPEADPTVGRTTDIPMEVRTLNINARVDKDHADSVSGGLRVYRKAEESAGTKSKMSFEQIKLEANTLFGLSYATEEIIEDSPTSLAALLSQGFEQEFASKKLQEKLNGSGTGEFEGVLTSPSKIVIAKESGQGNGTVLNKNIAKMVSQLWGGQGLFMANHGVLPELSEMGSANTVKNIWMPSSVMGAPSTLYGLPIVFTEFLPALGQEGDIILVNWSQYLTGTYKARRNASSVEVRFVEHEQAFKFWERNDGKCWWRSALKPKNGPDKSPIVVLGARTA